MTYNFVITVITSAKVRRRAINIHHQRWSWILETINLKTVAGWKQLWQHRGY